MSFRLFTTCTSGDRRQKLNVVSGCVGGRATIFWLQMGMVLVFGMFRRKPVQWTLLFFPQGMEADLVSAGAQWQHERISRVRSSTCDRQTDKADRQTRWSIYTYDITEDLFTIPSIFADDIALIPEIDKEIIYSFDWMQNDINTLQSWANENKLSFNTEKSVYMIVKKLKITIFIHLYIYMVLNLKE